MSTLSDQANEVAHKIEMEWGAFRTLIARHPLTGFWIGVALGGGITYGVLRLFGL